jgi:glutamate-1-semialdehyde 2,1-aminomutase
MGSDVMRNGDLSRRAERVMPGAQSNLRSPLGAKPLFIVRGDGAHMWDVDGNGYIDFMIAAGPGVLGHGNKAYLQALKDQLDTLYYSVSGASQTPMEVELAEKFVQHVPCAQKVRFCLSGTEAVQLAIRLARAYTKRRYFIRFEGHYGGWLDNVLGGVVNENTTGKPFPMESDQDPLGTEGRDPGAFEQCFLLPWNDIEVLERVLERYGEEVAMVHMEAINCTGGCCPPRPEYLERVRELCTRYGIVLSFDEVITGFRVALHGAQGEVGVTPDLGTFGKAMAGGVPMAAVAGKKEIMDLLLERRVVGAGTFNGYVFGVAASLATLKILERDNGAYYKKIDGLQSRLVEGLKEISTRYGIPTLIQGPRGMFLFQFIDKKVAYSVRDLREADVQRQSTFRTLLAQEGVLIMWGGRWYVSGALTEADVDRTLECADWAMGRL